jgi:tetratricopeptide (TPR) repeat protein
MGKLEEADELQTKAHQVLERSLGPNHPKVAQVLYDLGQIQELKGELKAAEEFYKKAMSARK